jgi:large subunit ribosomal protein L18
MYFQLIDDVDGRTLASASTLDKEIRDKLTNSGNVDGAAEVGKLIAEKARAPVLKMLFLIAAAIFTTAGSQPWQKQLAKLA